MSCTTYSGPPPSRNLKSCSNNREASLKRRLRPYFASNRQADHLTFKDVFRHAALHGLIGVEASERWMAYRDNRNDTAHDYGEGFAETTIGLLEQFIPDARELARIIGEDTDE